MNSLDLGLIGNGSISALVDNKGEIVWSCFPRFDGDPVFCSLLRESDGDDSFGFFGIELEGLSESEQRYQENTAILVTRLQDSRGGVVEIADFCPHFVRFGRVFQPMALIRRITRISGSPRIRIRVRPAGNYGAERPQHTFGTNHVRYLLPGLVLRL
ncbi:MAG TPA: trehalase-like domain-containing protein, partial [Rhodocyclaceae bacterium]|nr:trehalase-like domain-containing protein [Rhodocyclaceae bacterium]